ncbi:hypothetical protein GCM10009551_049920 [Nocardiopsis tropica]
MSYGTDDIRSSEGSAGPKPGCPPPPVSGRDASRGEADTKRPLSASPRTRTTKGAPVTGPTGAVRHSAYPLGPTMGHES